MCRLLTIGGNSVAFMLSAVVLLLGEKSKKEVTSNA